MQLSNSLMNLFLERNLREGYEIVEVLQDASLRKYYRVLSSDKTYVLMDCPPSYTKITPFLEICKHLYNIGVSAPEIYDFDLDNGFILMEDLGSLSFNRILDSSNEENIYKTLLDTLIHIQESPAPHLNLYNNDLKIKELDIFCKWYWEFLTGKPMTQDEKEDFLSIISSCLELIPDVKQYVFIHKDYHVDNLIYIESRKGVKSVGVLDFQDALLGHCAGDVAMLLDDARRFVSPELRSSMINYYTSARSIDKYDFEEAYNIISAQCNLRILGVFARKLLLHNNDSYAKRYMTNTIEYLRNNLKIDSLQKMRKYLSESGMQI